MADALCGPSNALQSFRKHTTIDRTLQQDRLAGPRFSAAQGFRTHDPRAGSLDADFHAFENAAPSALPFQLQEPAMVLHQANNILPPANQTMQNAAPFMLDWATDFSRMQIADHPIPAQQFRTEAPLMTTTNGGWQNDFAQQQQQRFNTTSTSTVAQGKQPMAMPMLTSLPGLMPFSSFSQSQPPTYQSEYEQDQGHITQQTSQQRQHAEERMSSEDWSQAFEDAYANVQAVDLETHHSSEEEEVQLAPPEQTVKIGADAIDYTEMKDRTADQDSRDANALARVAGELLHNVRGEVEGGSSGTTDTHLKFANSQFFDLMRRIRDREVEVRNNDFESTQSNGIAYESIPSTMPVMSAMPSTTSPVATQEEEVLLPQEPQQRPQTPPLEQVSNQDQDQDTYSFSFPDMNAIYEPTNTEDYVDYSFDSDQFPSAPDPAPAPAPTDPTAPATYYHNNHRPETQIQDLHPGGRFYPHSPPRDVRRVEMSGGVGAGMIPTD